MTFPQKHYNKGIREGFFNKITLCDKRILNLTTEKFIYCCGSKSTVLGTSRIKLNTCLDAMETDLKMSEQNCLIL